MTNTVYIARQPIFDRDAEVLGYELLFRERGEDQTAVVDDDDQATSQVLLHTFMEIGLERIAGERLAFFNLGHSFLSGRFPLPFPPEQVVIEVIERTPVDQALLAGVHHLVADGYRIALDDVVYDPALAPLLDLAWMVKVDVRRVGPDGLAEQVDLLRRHDVLLVAEKVEDHEMLAWCKALGFDYFQGFVLSHPNMVAGRAIPLERLASLQLLATVNRPGTSFEQLEALVRQNVALSYRVLRAVNSASAGLVRRIDSVRDAVVLLGQQKIRNWLTLMVLADVQDTPKELATTAMVRAKTCERLAVATGRAHPDTCFTAGLLSVLDAIMQAPMAEVLAQLPLSQRLTAALLDRAGPEGQLLSWTIAWEQEDWETLLEPMLADVPVGVAYLEGVAWSLEVGL
jgi:EAL and modified HD-GYP domain-containing signal transduction protein